MKLIKKTNSHGSAGEKFLLQTTNPVPTLIKTCFNLDHTLSVPAPTGIDFFAKYCMRISLRIFFRRNNCIAVCEHFKQASIASVR
jgi:hypothetical protein